MSHFCAKCSGYGTVKKNFKSFLSSLQFLPFHTTENEKIQSLWHRYDQRRRNVRKSPFEFIEALSSIVILTCKLRILEKDINWAINYGPKLEDVKELNILKNDRTLDKN